MVIKNVWALQIDEVIVADKIKKVLKDEYEVFFPVNAQLAYIDLILFNKKNNDTRTIQVKSSISVEDGGYEYSIQKIHKDKINPKKVDFFVFACYFRNGRKIETHHIVIPTDKLVKKIKESKDTKKIKASKDFCKFNFNVYRRHIADFGQLRKEIDEDEGESYSEYHNKFKLLKF